MDGLRQDLRFALRMLRKAPSVTLVAVLALALAALAFKLVVLQACAAVALAVGLVLARMVLR